MLHALLQHSKGNRRDIGPSFRRLDNVPRMSDRGGKNLSIDFRIHTKHFGNLLNQIHARLGNVVETAHKGRHDERAGARGQQCLIGIEAEGHVGADALPLEPSGSLQPFDGRWDLDDHIGVPGGEFHPFLDHSVRILRNRLGADGTVDQTRDLLDRFLEIGSLFSRHQRRVSRHTTENPPTGHLFDLANVRGIKEYLHNASEVSRVDSDAKTRRGNAVGITPGEPTAGWGAKLPHFAPLRWKNPPSIFRLLANCK